MREKHAWTIIRIKDQKGNKRKGRNSKHRRDESKIICVRKKGLTETNMVHSQT